jgi:hypothetical protein
MFQKSVNVFAVLLLLAAGAAVAQPTTVYVSPVSGNPVASGTALLNALAGITDNSVSKLYVVKLDPGVYSLSSTELVMKPYVDIEGSGQVSTIISGVGNSDGSYTTGTVQTAAQAELRNLQVASAGWSQLNSIGIYVPAGANTRIRDVTVTAGGGSNNNWGIRSLGASPVIQNVTINVSGGGYQSYGIGTTSSNAKPVIKRTVINLATTSSYAYGIYSDGVSAPQAMRDLEISVTGSAGSYGIYVDSYGSGQTFLLTGSTLSASGATYDYGIVFYGNAGGVFNVKTSSLKAGSGTNSVGFFASSTSNVTFNQSEIAGSTFSIQAAGTLVDVGASRVSGSVSGGTVACAGAYNASFVALNATCH